MAAYRERFGHPPERATDLSGLGNLAAIRLSPETGRELGYTRVYWYRDGRRGKISVGGRGEPIAGP